jgi:hypothetical protein
MSLSLKRSSSCLETLTLHKDKKTRFSYVKKPVVKYVLRLTGKRNGFGLDECNELLKRARLEESNINLVISEAKPVKKAKYVVFVRGDIEMAYCQSVDPRHFYAIDIQKTFRGWSTRRRIKQGILLNFFN